VPDLRLTADEAQDLKLALDVRLHALRVELSSTDSHDYRRLVRERLDRLEAIATRLEAFGGAGDGRAAGS
jgi:hypothetical protein